MAEQPDIQTGVFLSERENRLYTFRHLADRIECATAEFPGVDSLLRDERYPLWLLRHSFGENLGPEHYEGPPFDENPGEEASARAESTASPGKIRDLYFHGLDIPISPRGYAHAVGPIHAGIIEPGHFRFALEGERIRSLNIRLGFQHRGVLSALRGRTAARAMPIAEAIAGDATVAYAAAFAEVFERALGLNVSPEIREGRLWLLELERIAVHTGDLGAIAADIGYYPLAGLCAQDRGVGLSAMERLTGSRFGRGAIWPGELRLPRAWSQTLLAELAGSLEKAYRRIAEQCDRALENATLRERLQGCGTVSRRQALRHGLVGLVARAARVACDLRSAEPIYRQETALELGHVGAELHGDALSRFRLRYHELEASVRWLVARWRGPRALPAPARGPLAAAGRAARPGVSFAAVESWRGSVLVALDIDAQGAIGQAYVRDPSVMNWHGLELAVREELIGDFPLNNKSFNLSYAGFDL